MKNYFSLLLIFSFIIGCGQKKDSVTPISNEQKVLSEIKEELTPSEELRKQETRQTFDALCTYSETVQDEIYDLSRQMSYDGNIFYTYNSSQPINRLHRGKSEENKSVLIKLLLLKGLDKEKAKQQLSENYDNLAKELSFKTTPNEKVNLAYLAAASTDKQEFISTLNKIADTYALHGEDNTPTALYLGKLAYFFNEAELQHRIEKLNLIKDFVNKFADKENLEHEVYLHIISFLQANTDERSDSIWPMDSNSSKYIKLSLALDSTVEEIEDCVNQYKRSWWGQSLVPGAYYNSEVNTIYALEILALKELSKQNIANFGYKVFLL